MVAFVMLIPSSLMQSISAFVAQNVGAGKEKRARDTMLCGMTMGICIGALVCIGVFLKGDIPSALFTQDEAVIVRAFEYLRGFAPEAVVTAILFSFIGYYNGHGQTLFVMIQGLAQTFLVRLPMSWYMSIQPDASLTNIGLAAPSATVFGILINGLYFLYYSRKVNGKK
ncbi:MAG: MATE family efflux transporter [Lachnospiraceae bacterium]|nr:MATE family efflux transporter [Lachnospiraceae bacterium]